MVTTTSSAVADVGHGAGREQTDEGLASHRGRTDRWPGVLRHCQANTAKVPAPPRGSAVVGATIVSVSRLSSPQLASATPATTSPARASPGSRSVRPPGSRLSFSDRSPQKNAITASGTFTQNTQRHPSVLAKPPPPTIGPDRGAHVRQSQQETRGCGDVRPPVVSLVTRLKATGRINAPRDPAAPGRR